MAGAALVLTGVSSLVGVMSSAGGVAHTGGGSGTVSPSFMEVFTWFQGLAMNGMLSVNYPPVYRSFTKNFAFSTGLIPWDAMQTGIDNFRSATGGNLTDNNVQFLRNNATLVNTDGTSVANTSSIIRRVLEAHVLHGRQFTTSVNGSSAAPSNSVLSKVEVEVSGIAAYVEQLAIPNGNTFMTALLVVGIIIALIVVIILLTKAILEIWALVGNFPKSLSGFRRHYWGTMARSIVQLILMAYGVLVLYSVYQFTNGDSWAAKALAAGVLVSFTGVLAFFSTKIWLAAKRSKAAEGDVSQLYEDKETWMKYSLFYDSYKKDWWWTFIPAIAYMIAKGTVVAAADGHGLAQTIAQLVIETLMLGLLLFTRPYERKSGNVINIFIQVIRALSVICILVFVEGKSIQIPYNTSLLTQSLELGVAQTTQTVTGVVLIAVQAALTGGLAILILANAIIICFKANPHRKRRKEAEKLNRDMDNLTPLHAHNSLLLQPSYTDSKEIPLIDTSPLSMTTSPEDRLGYSDPRLPPLRSPINPTASFHAPQERANPYGDSLTTSTPAPIGYPFTKANTYQSVMQPPPQQQRAYGAYRPGHRNLSSQDSTEGQNLVSGAAPIGMAMGSSPPRGYGGQQPTVPDMGGYRGMPYR